MSTSTVVALYFLVFVPLITLCVLAMYLLVRA